MCMDWDKELLLRPNYSSNILLRLVPCDKMTMYGFDIDDECVIDQEQQKAYLDPN